MLFSMQMLGRILMINKNIITCRKNEFGISLLKDCKRSEVYYQCYKMGVSHNKMQKYTYCILIFADCAVYTMHNSRRSAVECGSH